MTINMVHLARVRDRIAEVGPDHCDMDRWIGGKSITPTGTPACGTVACIAGWAAVLAVNTKIVAHVGGERTVDWSANGQPIDVPLLAQEWLGLTDHQVRALFGSNWPYEFLMMQLDEGHGKAMVGLLDAMLDGTVVLDVDGRWHSEDENSLD